MEQLEENKGESKAMYNDQKNAADLSMKRLFDVKEKEEQERLQLLAGHLQYKSRAGSWAGTEEGGGQW